ncbi:unnamed protein product [Heterosigma akashiwo]
MLVCQMAGRRDARKMAKCSTLIITTKQPSGSGQQIYLRPMNHECQNYLLLLLFQVVLYI